MTLQNQYAETLAKTQETWAEATALFTENVQKAFSAPIPGAPDLDPSAALDQLFDFWEKALAVQRDTVKQLVSAAFAAGGEVRAQAESLGTAFKDQVESVQNAATGNSSKEVVRAIPGIRRTGPRTWPGPFFVARPSTNGRFRSSH